MSCSVVKQASKSSSGRPVGSLSSERPSLPLWSCSRSVLHTCLPTHVPSTDHRTHTHQIRSSISPRHTTNVTKLNHYNPVLGAYVPDKIAEYVVSKTSPLLAKSNNVDTVAKVSDAEVTGSHRSLEASSTDIERIESHFGTPMEHNFTTLFSSSHLAASFDPVPWTSSYWPDVCRRHQPPLEQPRGG